MTQGKVLITGSGGLVGSEAVIYYASRGYQVHGMDNNLREVFFGTSASVQDRIDELEEGFKNFENYSANICDKLLVDEVVKTVKPHIIIHTAAQPSHDFAAKDPLLDFNVNAVGTLNLLEAARTYVPECKFVYTSTNKVYGDTPNNVEYRELDTRYESIFNYIGIDESMSIDTSTHSIFGVSKASADLMVQEYGKYFKMNTICFRCGCITGPAHRGAELHGFLSYLMKCVKHELPYTIYGYKGKQVRDNIHASDLVTAFDEYIQRPSKGVVYNIGGGRENSCSVLEAIEMCENIAGKKLKYEISGKHRVGDHKWWISSNYTFQRDYPSWKQEYNLEMMLREICDAV